MTRKKKLRRQHVIFHAYKFSYLSWRGDVTRTQARANVHVLAFSMPRAPNYRFRQAAVWFCVAIINAKFLAEYSGALRSL